MKPKFFPAQEDFRKWLEENHDKKDKIVVGFYNVKLCKGGMSWSEARERRFEKLIVESAAGRKV